MLTEAIEAIAAVEYKKYSELTVFQTEGRRYAAFPTQSIIRVSEFVLYSDPGGSFITPTLFRYPEGNNLRVILEDA